MNANTTVRKCDTLIIGSSMAGGCLARQLKLKHPGMDIVVLEKKREFDYWVGESTLESFWDYATRHLELGRYLDTHHVYKHGLRFFYDSPEHDLPIDQMSEVGRSWFHSTPAHQLDRKRFDTDLVAFNRASGVDVRMGVAVQNIELDREGGHTVVASDGTYKCRWLVDAGGFAAPLGRKLGIIKPTEDHPISSYWGRFKNVIDLDQLGSKEWRARTQYVTRSLATTHFMYGSYWIWLIPVDAETFSIGVTIRHDMTDIEIKGQEELVAFLRTHKFMQQMLERAELVDYHQMKKLARRADRFFSEDRWFLTGIAGVFLDPLLSPGSAWLADANRMIGELIATDMAGDEQAYRTQAKAFNIYADFWLDNFFLHIKGHYHDCYDRQRVYFEQLLRQWFGIILPTSMTENWGYTPGMTADDIAALEAKTKMMMEQNSIVKIDHLIEEFCDFLKARNLEYANNRGQWFDIEIGDQGMRNTRTRGAHLCPENIMEVERKMMVVTVKHALRRMAQIENISYDESRLEEIANVITDDHLTLARGLEMLAAGRPQALVA